MVTIIFWILSVFVAAAFGFCVGAILAKYDYETNRVLLILSNEELRNLPTPADVKVQAEANTAPGVGASIPRTASPGAVN
jgi:hypothetical protein